MFDSFRFKMYLIGSDQDYSPVPYGYEQILVTVLLAALPLSEIRASLLVLCCY